MTERTLKEVAQAGLVLGFEWIEVNDGSEIRLWHSRETIERLGINGCIRILATITDLPPERSLLRLRDIVEAEK